MSQSALTLTQRNSLHFKAGWQIHGSHAPFCPPISMSGMLNDKDAISYWAFWESSSTQHSRQSGDQSQRESRNSFAIPTLTRCKSIPQKITLSAYLLGFSSCRRFGLLVFVNKICYFVSFPLTWVQAAVDRFQQTDRVLPHTLESLILWELPLALWVLPWPYAGTTQKWGRIMRSDPYPPPAKGETRVLGLTTPQWEGSDVWVPYSCSEVQGHAVILCSLASSTSLSHFLPSLFMLPRSLKSPSQGLLLGEPKLKQHLLSSLYVKHWFTNYGQ